MGAPVGSMSSVLSFVAVVACRPVDIDVRSIAGGRGVEADPAPDRYASIPEVQHLRPIGRSNAAPLMDVQTIGFRQSNHSSLWVSDAAEG